jgi:hypothetical protein
MYRVRCFEKDKLMQDFVCGSYEAQRWAEIFLKQINEGFVTIRRNS